MIEEFITDLAHSLGAWSYLLVAAMAMAETAAFLGFIAPGEFAIILGGVLAGEGTLSIELLIGIAWTSCVIGDSIGFALGRRLGRAFALEHGHKVRLTEDRINQVESYFQRHGGKTIVIGRWLGFVRPLMPFTAGTSGMNYRRFLPYDVVGAGLWSATFCLLGFTFWRSFDQLTNIAGKGALAFGITLVVFIGIYQAVKRLRKREDRRRLAAWLDRQGRRPALRPVAAVVRAAGVALRPVWRYALGPLWRLIAPPLRFLFGRLTPGGLGIELTTLVAIATVSVYVLILQIGLVDGGDLIAGDGWALDAARDMERGALTTLAEVISFFGKLWVVSIAVLATAGLLVAWRRRLEAMALTAGLIVAEATQLIIKDAVERPRPADGLADAGGFAYPSGHAALGVSFLAIAVVLSRVAPLSAKVGLVVGGLVLAVLEGLSRVYLRVHYLSDVVGGWATGAAAYSICAAIALVAAYLHHSFSASPEEREARAASRPEGPPAGRPELPADVPASRRASS